MAADGDVIALLNVRRGTVAWRPALDRLPRVLVRRFPALDVLTVYLSETEVAALVAQAVDGVGDDDLELPAEHITLALTPGEPEMMLRRLFYNGFPDHPGRASVLAREVAATHEDDAPEVMPGVVFYHAHVDVEAPMTFVGVCEAGAALPGTGSPAQVVLALLAPRAMPPDGYLRTLSVVAQQLVRSDATVEALLEAETPEAARDLLLGALRPDAPASVPPEADETEAASD